MDPFRRTYREAVKSCAQDAKIPAKNYLEFAMRTLPIPIRFYIKATSLRQARCIIKESVSVQPSRNADSL